MMFKDIVRSDSCPPLVFRGVIEAWPARQWTVKSLADKLGSKQLTCKIASINREEVQWETESIHLQVTLHQYMEWLDGSCTENNPLNHLHADKFSCYFDYKYMKDMFIDKQDILKEVDWSVFGLEGRTGHDSTVWIGSAGSYTPCHYDTYGFNLVAQITGRKRWYLFHPEHTAALYPTRIPYEESSVYSEVNIRNPDMEKHSLFTTAEPYIVELNPGDVLYVPKHWWHFVESVESSISINTWVPLASDVVSHVEESVCRLLFSNLSAGLLPEEQVQTFVNTGEVVQPDSVNIQYVNTAVSRYHCYTEAEQTRWMDMFILKFEHMKILVQEKRDWKTKGTKRKRSCDNTEKMGENSNQIFAVPSMTFADFNRFLDYCNCEHLDSSAEESEHCLTQEEMNSNKTEKHEYTTSKVTNHCDFVPVNVHTESCEQCDVKSVKEDSMVSVSLPSISNIEIMKATLDPSVIKLISHLLLERSKT